MMMMMIIIIIIITIILIIILTIIIMVNTIIIIVDWVEIVLLSSVSLPSKDQPAAMLLLVDGLRESSVRAPGASVLILKKGLFRQTCIEYL